MKVGLNVRYKRPVPFLVFELELIIFSRLFVILSTVSHDSLLAVKNYLSALLC